MSKRIETKYLIDERSFHYLKSILPRFLTPDPHAGEEGYKVTSLYFDDEDLKAYYDKEEGELVKEKWRLRFYNHDLNTLRLEKKMKHGQISHKEIYSEHHILGLQPKIIVSYQRLAFENKEIRVTLDSQLEFDRARVLSDLESERKNEYSPQIYLLEVKHEMGLQSHHLNQIIDELNLKSSPFSKYNEGMKHLYDL